MSGRQLMQGSKRRAAAVFGAILILGLLAYMAGLGLAEVLFEILLTATSIVLALAYADLGKARLVLEILPPEPVQIGEGKRADVALFLKLRAWNQPRRGWPFVSRRTALSCHGEISCASADGRNMFRMAIRWSNNPQPVRPDRDRGVTVGLLDRSLLRASRFIDIAADEFEDLDVCRRNLNENTANGWNSDNYEFRRHMHPQRNIPRGSYKIRVKIAHAEGSAHATFSLTNPADIAQFRLEADSPGTDEHRARPPGTRRARSRGAPPHQTG